MAQKNIQEAQNKGILCKRNKEIEVEKLILGFLGTSIRAHTRA